MVEIFLLFVTAWAVLVLHVLASVYALKIVLVIAFAVLSPFHICHFLCFCPLDEFGVRAKQLEHEGPTYTVPLTERKELTVSNSQE